MTYILRKSNNQQIVVLNDGLVDQSLTSLTLIGKNVSNFGAEQNENFIYLLENFANSSATGSAPRAPLTGQIWFDTNSQVCRPLAYDGTSWRPLAVSMYGLSPTNSLINATSTPAIPFAASQPGDFWVDSSSNQLYVITSTASDVSLIGPEVVPGYSTTKMSSAKMNDNIGGSHPVILTYLNGEVISVFSNVTFTQTTTNPISGFPIVYRGITFKNYDPNILSSSTSSDVVLYGLYDRDAALARVDSIEHIRQSWYFDNNTQLNFGTAGQGNITYNTGTAALTLISAGSVVLRAATNPPKEDLTFNGAEFYPSANSVTLGTSNNLFGAAYLTTVSAGTSSTNGYLEGQWLLTPTSNLTPFTSGASSLGSSSNLFSTVYTSALNAGSAGASGILTGAWNLSNGSLITPVSDLSNNLGGSSQRFNTVYVSAISGLSAITGSPTIAGSITPSIDNSYALGAANLAWSSIYTRNLQSSSATIALLYSNTGTFVSLTAAVGTVTNFKSTTGSINYFTAISATATSITANSANITTEVVGNSTISTGNITNLTAGTGNIVNLTATTGTITTVNATNVSANTLGATNGTITSLNATNAGVTNLGATNAAFNNLQSTATVVTNLTATSANIGTLSASSITVNNETVGNLTAAVSNLTTATVSNLRATYATVNNLNATYSAVSTLTFATIQDGFSHAINKIDPDGTLSANSDLNLATQKAIVTYVNYMITQVASPIPAGSVFYVAMNTAPAGYLVCDGASYSTSAYPALHSAIGYTFGGIHANFNVPDLRGQFIRGLDLGAGIDPGRTIGSTQAGMIETHAHYEFANSNSGYGNIGNYPNAAPSANASGDSSGASYDIGTNNSDPATVGLTSHTGGTETRPTNVALLPIIKT